MIKRFVVNTVFIFISSLLFAQNKGFDAGIFLGFNGIHIEGQNEVLYNSTDGTIWGSGGISAGLSVKRNLSKSFYWAFNLQYIRKGSIYEFVNNYGRPDFEVIKLDYAELPILLGYRIRLSKRFLYFEAGASVAKLLNSKKLISEYNYGQDISLFDRFKNYDYSALAELKISTNRKEKFIIGVRIERSFLSIHKVYKLYNFDYGVELSYFL